MSSISNVEIMLNEYRNEFNRAASSYFAWKVLAELPASDDRVLSALNHNADSWILIRHSLQTTFIVALGRIFDADPKSFTVCLFLETCKSEIGQFSKQEFEARRTRDNRGRRPDYLDAYMSNVYEAVESDFDALLKLANDQATIYNNKYKPIRHKIVAHKDLTTFLSDSDLYAATNLGEIETMLETLYRVECVVRDLLGNGEKKVLESYAFDRKQYIVEDLSSLLRTLTA